MPGHHPVRPADLRGPVEHRSRRAGLQRADRPRRGHRPQRRTATAPRTAATSATRSPRAASRRAPCPGTPGYVHVVATDEHDEDGVLISDEFTNPHKRQAMHEKRMRKMDGVLPLARAAGAVRPGGRRRHAGRLGLDRGRHPRGDRAAAPTQGITANHLQIKWLVPLHADAILTILPATPDASSSSRTTTAASSRATCASRPASSPTATSASTTASRSCRTTSSKASRHILAGTTKLVRARARDHGVRESRRWQRTRCSSRTERADADGQGPQGQGRSRLVPRLRRLRRARGAEAGARRAGPPAARGPDRQRHRLLVEPARLHQHLRHAHPARPRAGRRHRRRSSPTTS